MDKKKNKINNRYFSRRQFLVGTGNFCLTLPPLLSMMPANVFAQATNMPKIRVFTAVGVFGIDYFQLYPDDAMAMNATGVSGIMTQNLDQMPNNISRILNFNDPNLIGLKSKTNLIRGLGLMGGVYAGHNHSVLSGTHSGGRQPIYGKSIDVIIEQSLGVNAVRVRTTNRGTNKASEFSFDRNSSGARQISPLTYGDRNLFNQLFPGGMTQPPPQSGGPSKERLVVDKVIQDLNALMNHNRISQNDRNTLSDYMDGVNDLQKRIIAQDSGSAPTCSQPNINYEVSGNQNPGSVDRLYNNYADLMVIAAQCDNARVFHLSNTAISNISSNGANPELHHGATGGSDGAADRQGWFLRRVGDLAQKLDAVSDPFDPSGNTLLDNSIILWTNELGSWTAAHSVTGIPVVTFGGGGGYFRTGEYIDYRQRPFLTAKNRSAHRYLGHPYKHLLISIMRAAGLNQNQYINIGDGNGFGEYKPTLDKADTAARNYYARFANTHNDPLPYVSLGG